jgi:hypothetical protein
MSRAVLCCFLPLSLGCSASPWKREVIYSRSGVVLYREHQEKEGKKVPLGYRHPVDLPAEKAGLVLSRLVFQEKKLFGPPIKRYIFTPEEVLASVKPLTKELAGIPPDERLRFLITRSRWSELFTGVTGTSGVAFCTEEGILHLALDRIQEHVTGAEEGDPMQVVFRDEPTLILDAPPLVPAGGMALHVDGATGKTFPRWLEIKIAEIRPAASPPEAKPQLPAAPAAEKAPEPSRSPEEEERYRRVRARLELLKRLRADGALSEEEYDKEKEKALRGMK